MPSANLVIQTAFLGDLILSVPVLRRIKYLYPDDELLVLCKKGTGEFLLREKVADRVLEVEKSNAASYRQALESLRGYSIRHLYCLHRSVRSQLFAAQVPARRKIGFSSFLGFWIFDDLVHFLPENPEVIRQFKILETTDEESFAAVNLTSYADLNLPGAGGALPDVPEFFSFRRGQGGRRSVRAPGDTVRTAVFPGSVWETKRWTAEGFTRLTQRLLQDGIQVDLLGGPAEKPLCEEIASAAPGARVLAGGLSVAESIGRVAEYDLLICNDSASTHMAALQGVPVVSIFGPTVPEQGFRPWNNGSYIVENKAMGCRPCGRHGHHECPLKHHLCMKSLAAEDVYRRVQKVLADLN